MSSEPVGGRLWTSAEAYEQYVGRWSRRVADEFLRWLCAAPGSRWLDVGCGTGALTERILESQYPASILGVDASSTFVASACSRLRSPRVDFVVGAAQELPTRPSAFDVAVTGLVLNFVPGPDRAIVEFARTLGAGSMAAAYLWDYARGMQMMRYFWDAAIALNPAAHELDEGERCSICQPELLEELWQSAGFHSVEACAIDVPTVFADFDDFWQPFLAGRAPAPAYVMSLSERQRTALREEIRSRVPVEKDGTLRLVARAWAVKGTASPRDRARN